MGFSLKLCRLFGIDVFVHWTFVAIPIFVIVNARMANISWSGVLFHLLFVLSVFACIVLHEFGHALSARGFGVATRDIILTPIGGLARLQRLPKHPLHEFVIAIAGPAVNVGIALIIAAGLLFTGQRILPANSFTIEQYFSLLMVANIILVAFNMLPAFPMDGGRMLRAVLSLFMGFSLATLVAGRLGQSIAVAFIALGVFWGQWPLALIGVFVILAAQSEINIARQIEREYERIRQLVAQRDQLGESSGIDLRFDGVNFSATADFYEEPARDDT